MTRKRLSLILAFALALAPLGCGQEDTARTNDMPVKSTAGTAKKGKANKTMEAGLEDPNAARQGPAKK